MIMNGVLHRINGILEAFKDIGKLSPEELMKGQRLDPNDKENFKQVTGRVFYQAVSKIRINDIAKGDRSKGLDTLTVYGVSEYKKMRCYLGKNNSSGYCIAHRNELVSVFSSQQSSGNALVKSAISNGAKRLDCFALRDSDTNKISGDLYKLYSRFGFKIDKSKNEMNEPYVVKNGVSDYVDDKGVVHPDDERVVIFMRL
jgi:hypothetical protein